MMGISTVLRWRVSALLAAASLALLALPQPLPATAADAPPGRWTLAETNINPSDAPTEFVVGVTPGYYESPRFDGTYDRYSVSWDTISHNSSSVERDYEYWNVSSSVNFQPPPSFMIAGETITLHASGSMTGSFQDDSSPMDQFEFRAEGVNLEGETYLWLGINPNAGPSSGSLSPEFVVPEPWGEDAEIRISAFYWNCAACWVEWVFRPDAAAPATTAPTNPTTTTTTTTPDDPEDCIIRGRVTDAGARPSGPPDIGGHPLVGVRVALLFETLDEIEVEATDADGRYEFILSKDDVPFTFDPAVEQFLVSLRLAEAAHDPPRFEVGYNSGRTALWSTPFVLDGDCPDGVIDLDFPLGAIPDDYLPVAPDDFEHWDDLGEIYHRTHNAMQLADLLGQRLDYEGMTVCAFCEKKAAPTLAFWCGALSNGAVCSESPWIGMGSKASTLADPGWPDNREYHEFGHHFQADAFGNAAPMHSANKNHAGYYVNPYSSDAWLEGFAEFFSMMVTKYIDERAMPHLYRIRGTPQSLELDYRAWTNRGRYEELALAGVLLDLEDGPDDYKRGRDLPALSVAWHDTYDDPALGSVIVGEVANNTRSTDVSGRTDYSEQTMVAAEFRHDGRSVGTAWAITTPWDIPGNGKTGFFAVVAPSGLKWDEVNLAAFEGRPGSIATDDDPVDLTLQEVWETIVSYGSVQDESNGFMFDIVDLHDAFRTEFGGADADGNGMDDIDQVFIAHGFFGDTDGDRSYNVEIAGRTDHPAAGPNEAMMPRRAIDPAEATLMTVDTGGVDAAVVVQTWLPDAAADGNYSYIAGRDAEGLYQVAVPPEGHGATVTLAVVADGYEPLVLTTLDADAFWADVLAGDDSAPSFSPTLVKEGGGGSDMALILLGGGLILLAGASAWWFRQRTTDAGGAADE